MTGTCIIYETSKAKPSHTYGMFSRTLCDLIGTWSDSFDCLTDLHGQSINLEWRGSRCTGERAAVQSSTWWSPKPSQRQPSEAAVFGRPQQVLPGFFFLISLSNVVIWCTLSCWKNNWGLSAEVFLERQHRQWKFRVKSNLFCYLRWK